MSSLPVAGTATAATLAVGVAVGVGLSTPVTDDLHGSPLGFHAWLMAFVKSVVLKSLRPSVNHVSVPM